MSKVIFTYDYKNKIAKQSRYIDTVNQKHEKHFTKILFRHFYLNMNAN